MDLATMDEASLRRLKRGDLQQLARVHGFAANAKSATIIKQLLREKIAQEQRSISVPAPALAPSASESPVPERQHHAPSPSLGPIAASHLLPTPSHASVTSGGLGLVFPPSISQAGDPSASNGRHSPIPDSLPRPAGHDGAQEEHEHEQASNQGVGQSGDDAEYPDAAVFASTQEVVGVVEICRTASFQHHIQSRRLQSILACLEGFTKHTKDGRRSIIQERSMCTRERDFMSYAQDISRDWNRGGPYEEIIEVAKYADGHVEETFSDDAPEPVPEGVVPPTPESPVEFVMLPAHVVHNVDIAALAAESAERKKRRRGQMYDEDVDGDADENWKDLAGSPSVHAVKRRRVSSNEARGGSEGGDGSRQTEVNADRAEKEVPRNVDAEINASSTTESADRPEVPNSPAPSSPPRYSAREKGKGRA